MSSLQNNPWLLDLRPRKPHVSGRMVHRGNVRWQVEDRGNIVIPMNWRQGGRRVRAFSHIWIRIWNRTFLWLPQPWCGALATICTLVSQFLTVGTLWAFLAPCTASGLLWSCQFLRLVALCRLTEHRQPRLLRIRTKYLFNALFDWRWTSMCFLGRGLSWLALNNLLSYSKVHRLAKRSKVGWSVLFGLLILVKVQRIALIQISRFFLCPNNIILIVYLLTRFSSALASWWTDSWIKRGKSELRVAVKSLLYLSFDQRLGFALQVAFHRLSDPSIACGTRFLIFDRIASDWIIGLCL